MENFRNYYEILGVSREAAPEEVKRAYRQLARRYHPDLNPGDLGAEEQFKQIGEAYDVLSDPDKRAQYEEFSSFWKQKGFQGIRFNWGKKEGGRSQAEVDFAAFRDFDKFVDQILNQHRDRSDRNGQSRSQPAAAVADPEPVSPSSGPSRSGASRSEGARSGTTQTRRPPSDRSSRRDAEADLTIPLEKAYLGGRERIRLEDGRSLEVNMPSGMLTGQRIRLRGQGLGGGNLYLRIEVQPHPFFSLQGNDVFCRVPLTPSEAALGGSIPVPTLDGLVRMTVPPGVQHGQRLRLAERGYPTGAERRGDQIIEVEIVIPSVLSDREKALYAELREMESLDPRADLPV